MIHLRFDSSRIYFAGAGLRAAKHNSEWSGGAEIYDAFVDGLHEVIDATQKTLAVDPHFVRNFQEAIAGWTTGRDRVRIGIEIVTPKVRACRFS